MRPLLAPVLLTALLSIQAPSQALAAPPDAPTETADLAKPEDFREASDPDDTLSFQRAAATGRTVALSGGKTYTLCATVAGRRFVGLGSDATVNACKNWPAPPEGVPAFPVYAFFANPNWGAAGITDRDLLVENITFDAGNVTFSNGGFHAVSFRQAERVLARNLTCRNVGDCTAFLATRDTRVENSRADNVTNVGFDHWEGPADALVTDSAVSCAASGTGYGVMFTGAATDYADKAGRDLVSRRNRVTGPCAAGIIANILSKGSSLTNVASEEDVVDIGNHPKTSGIIFTGNIRGGRIVRPVVTGCNGGQAIVLSWDKGEPTSKGGSGVPTGIRITEPTIRDCKTAPENVAPLVVLGKDNAVIGGSIRGGSYSRPVWTESPTTTVKIAVDPSRR